MEALDQKQLDQVAALFIRLGADAARADVMARQLLKRAKQIAEQRGVSELEALKNLLKQVVEARQGS